MQTPNYLLQKPSGYYFRYQLPADIRQVVNQSELRYSLRTRTLGLAKSKARLLAGTVQNIIRIIRGGYLPTLTDGQMVDLIKANVRRTLEAAEQGLTQEGLGTTPNYTQDRSINVPKSYAPTPPPRVSTQQQAPTMKVSELIGRYITEGQRERRWTNKSQQEVEACINVFVRAMGDIPVDTIDHDLANRYKDVVLKLPPNMNKAAEYKGKTVNEILRMKPTKTLSVKSVNKLINRISLVFDYGIRHGFMVSNPMSGLGLKGAKGKENKRAVFTADDLRSLFTSLEYREDTFQYSYHFWMPTLGLYTGGRINELAQLHLEDFKQVDGIWCIDINRNSEGQRVKTDAGVRVVPLHPFLVEDLGIIRRVEALKTQGVGRLFPELNPGRDGYGQMVTRWFRRYRVRCGITSGAKVFHSFRHTVTTQLAHSSVDDHLIRAIVGHSESSVTFGTSVKKYPVKLMYEALVKSLNYDVDLDHLKASKYAGSNTVAGTVPAFSQYRNIRQ